MMMMMMRRRRRRRRRRGRKKRRRKNKTYFLCVMNRCVEMEFLRAITNGMFDNRQIVWKI
jgi:hypothetical protein